MNTSSQTFEYTESCESFRTMLELDSGTALIVLISAPFKDKVRSNYVRNQLTT